MHWIDWLLKEYKIKSRYELCKRTKLKSNTLTNIVKRDQCYSSTSFQVIWMIAEGLGITLDELKNKLDEFSSQ